MLVRSSPEGQYGLALQTVVFTGARPLTSEVFSISLALFFPVVAAFYIHAFAPARPVAVAIISFALAFFFTSLRISTGGRAMLAPTGGGFLTTLSFRQW